MKAVLIALIAFLLGLLMGAFLAEQTKDCSAKYHQGIMAVMHCPGTFSVADSKYTCYSETINKPLTH